MPNLIYRLVSACCPLGYGDLAESTVAAVAGRVDLAICNDSALHAGRDCRSASEAEDIVRADFGCMVPISITLGCPLVLAGGTCQLGDLRTRIALDVFAEYVIPAEEIAVIAAASNEGVRSTLDAAMPTLGLPALISALDNGARYIVIERASDSALFASDIIRRGIDADVAYRVGAVLESSMRAREARAHPACVIAEIHDDLSTQFVSPAANGRPHDSGQRSAQWREFRPAHPQSPGDPPSGD